MKKKFLTFMLAVIFLIPCIFALTGCGEEPHKHVYEHGLCSCGDYTGKTQKIENGSQITFNEVGAGKTVYGRYEISKALHYYYSRGFQLTAENSEIKFYARYKNANTGKTAFIEIKVPAGTASTLGYFFDILPVDGYVYVEFTNKSEESVTNFGLSVYPSSHSHAIDFSSTGVIDLDEEFSGGNHYCYKYTATSGRYLIYTKSDFVEFPEIYDSENNLLNANLEKSGGNFYLTLAENEDLFFHFFCNTVEDSDDSHFTIRVA